MYNKPQTVPVFEAGKTPYTVEGFVDFFNWLCWLMAAQEIDTRKPENPKIVPRYV